ncbi:hypothetical protein BG015_004101 [Linnemannia schmuckeri]|uniref:RanBD1 domain-containing protein n=1 Tax=Linnemannia schmuckeri TaxID=64567 RepID=A0A9P5S5G3_9FUNG|nr:hypothetical protein BG015_004101 [Linnemannia schmuckeri]
MSKRGTENQLTKDEYDRDGDNDEGSSIQGVFKQASQEEMAKRVIKAPRARRLNGGGGGDGVAKPSPFANMPSFATPSASTATSSSPFASVSFAAPTTPTPTTGAAPTAKPFSTGTFNFGVAPSSTSTSASTTLASTTPSTTSGGLFNFGITPSSTPKPSTSTTTSAPLFTSSTTKAKTTSTLTPGAFTFNVGSAPLATSSSADADKSGTPDREELERYLQALNRTFVKKIEKELINNPIVNLAQIFGQYTDKRQAIKKKYMTSTDAKSTASSPALGSASLQNGSLLTGSSGATTSGSDAAPKLSFGVPLSAIGENPTPKPAFGGFNFGVSAAITTSTTATDSKATTSAAITTSSPFAFSVPKPAASTAGATTTSLPFSFSAPKPFSFGTAPSPFSTSSSTAAPAAPAAGGGFQFSVPASHPFDKKDEGDNEKMPDDTKSQLVDSRAGEEGEETVFEVKGKLYAVVDGENKDLGVGQFRVNENIESKKRRMIMRTGGTGQLILNNWVIQGMGPKRTKNFVTILAVEDGKPKKFLLKVKEEVSAEDVVRELEAGQSK